MFLNGCFDMRSLLRKAPLRDEVIEQEMIQIRDEFFRTEVDKRRLEAIDVNRKMKKVMDAWLGIAIEDIFCEWKGIVENIRKESQKSLKLKLEDDKRMQDEMNERLLMAKKEVRNNLSETVLPDRQ